MWRLTAWESEVADRAKALEEREERLRRVLAIDGRFRPTPVQSIAVSVDPYTTGYWSDNDVNITFRIAVSQKWVFNVRLLSLMGWVTLSGFGDQELNTFAKPVPISDYPDGGVLITRQFTWKSAASQIARFGGSSDFLSQVQFSLRIDGSVEIEGSTYPLETQCSTTVLVSRR